MHNNEIYKIYNSTHIGKKIGTFIGHSAASFPVPAEHDIKYDIYKREYYNNGNAIIGSIYVSIDLGYSEEKLLEIFYKYSIGKESAEELQLWAIEEKEKGIAATAYKFFDWLYKECFIYSMRDIRDYIEKHLYYFPIISLSEDVEKEIKGFLSEELQEKQEEIANAKKKELELREKAKLLQSIREDIIGGKKG